VADADELGSSDDWQLRPSLAHGAVSTSATSLRSRAQVVRRRGDLETDKRDGAEVRRVIAEHAEAVAHRLRSEDGAGGP
jgi:hypothetical protein